MISTWQIFLILVKVNVITFGGGYTIAPVLLGEFARKRELITEEQMLDMIALAQSGPGSLAASVSLLIGYKLKGTFGAFIGMLASILPPLVIISVIYFFYAEFATNYWVRAALRGMSGMIGAILLFTTIDLAKVALKQNLIFSIIMMVGSFLLVYFTSINVAFIIILLALIGLIVFSLPKKEES